jgi:hypothetical protein
MEIFLKIRSYTPTSGCCKCGNNIEEELMISLGKIFKLGNKQSPFLAGNYYRLVECHISTWGNEQSTHFCEL